jgi:TrpR family trp operon transcriptional repressor
MNPREPNQLTVTLYQYIETMSNPNLSFVRDLIERTQHNPHLLRDVLEDLLTPAEIDDLAQRWRIVQDLHKGLPQREIAQNLHVSLSKVTRGSRVLLNPKGGFNRLLSEIK